MGGHPSWPGMIWDPRFLGSDRSSKFLMSKAYQSLGKSHIVCFYPRLELGTVPYKQLKPYDHGDLQAQLKTTRGPAKRVLLAEAAEAAKEACTLSRVERVAQIHALGRTGGSRS
ncbi:unnamed protein product, partial [Discosporangium mesarthrocarpum]